MKIVVDTNVIISGVFFGGAPGDVLNAIVESKVKQPRQSSGSKSHD